MDKEPLDYQLDLVQYTTYENYAITFHLHIGSEDGVFKVISKKVTHRPDPEGRFPDSLLVSTEVEEQSEEFDDLDSALEFGAKITKCLE